MLSLISPLSVSPVRNEAFAAKAFERAHRLGRTRSFIDRLLGRFARLERLDEAGRGLAPLLPQPERLQDIPLDAITGSVGRGDDYTRDFLPRRAGDEVRWVGIYLEMAGAKRGLPPIRVQRLGERYYVVDGHHRVSVARWRRHRSIEALVTELRPLRPAAQATSCQRHARVPTPCPA